MKQGNQGSAPQASWNDTRRILEEALARRRAERAAYVARECGARSALEAEVLELLAADEGEDALLDAGATAHLAAWDAPPDDAAPGERVGPYVLQEAIGEGGTSRVHRALDPDGRPVALKLLHPGLARGELRERFLAEREVLAGLDHPGIVKLVDAGAHAGRPYLVTELVDGVPIDRFCRERLGSGRDVLRLFLRLTEAVHHAHAHLVVHRDLKPGNVLVTRAGEPKVLDFGVAKLLHAPWSRTRPGGRAPLTPAYASPEQLRGDPVTTAADVYALGVLLRELVTGEAPRGGGPPARVRGDLGTVLECATRAEPERRYASVPELAADLRRVLDRRPVSAKRPALLDAAWKWALRNPLAAALAGAGAIALFVALGVSTASLARARASERIAWDAHANAVYVTDYWADVMERVAAGDLAGRADVVRLLAEAEERVAADLGRRPEAEARMRQGIARVYATLGEWERAEPHARRALELARGTRGLGTRDRGASLFVLTGILLARGDAQALDTARELGALCAATLDAASDEARRAGELVAQVRERFE